MSRITIEECDAPGVPTRIRTPVTVGYEIETTFSPIRDWKAGADWRSRDDHRHRRAWILNGEKTFIANGGVGKMFFARARTDPNVPAQQGSTIFVVPVDTPGFRIGKIIDKSGWRF